MGKFAGAGPVAVADGVGDMWQVKHDFFSFFFGLDIWDFFGIEAFIRTNWEIQFLLHAGFLSLGISLFTKNSN